MIIHNEDFDEYFVVAVEPYNIYNEEGKIVFCMYRGQAFKWKYKTIEDIYGDGCVSCQVSREETIITGKWDCEEGFKDEDGNPVMWRIPSEKLEETYDTEDFESICESWMDEVGGYNKDLFTPPHLREEYEDWNNEKGGNYAEKKVCDDQEGGC